MLDALFVALSVIFFVAGAAISQVASDSNEDVMTLESIAGLVISVLLLAYLVYAMLWPEKF